MTDQGFLQLESVFIKQEDENLLGSWFTRAFCADFPEIISLFAGFLPFEKFCEISIMGGGGGVE
jgi:hypothetical protein